METKLTTHLTRATVDTATAVTTVKATQCQVMVDKVTIRPVATAVGSKFKRHILVCVSDIEAAHCDGSTDCNKKMFSREGSDSGAYLKSSTSLCRAA